MQDFELLLQSKQLQSSPCGCYTRPQHQQSRTQKQKLVLVPLTSSEITVEIVNSLANVTLVQHYKNPTNQSLQMEYAFPSDTKNCFYKFIADYGNITIEGVVKDKEQAEKQYQQNLSCSKDKIKLEEEISQQINDSFMLNLGRVPPQQHIRVQVTFLQELSLSGNKLYQLHLSKNIFPRYMDYVSVDQLNQGFRNIANKEKNEFYWNFSVSLKNSHRLNFWDSSTHVMKLIDENVSGTESTFTLKEASIINKDFIFSFSTENVAEPTYLLGQSHHLSSAMISFVPELENKKNAETIYQKISEHKQILCDLDTIKGQYIFLLDRSCSMSGRRIKHAKEAVTLFLKSLPTQSYFNVISFGSEINKMFPQSVGYTDENISQAIQKIRKMEADLGGTYIYNIFQELLTQKKIQGHPRQLFLLTDGAVPNTAQVIKLVSRNTQYSRVHTIGFGNECSRELILGCAKKGRGYYVFIADGENPCQKIIQLLRKSITPVITDLRLNYDKSQVKSIQPNPENMPFIYKNQIVNFYVIFNEKIITSTPFSITYQHPLDGVKCKHEVVIDPHVKPISFVDRMVHFKRIKALQKTIYNKGHLANLLYSTEQISKKAEVVRESVENQILSYFTAFVCLQTNKEDNKGRAKGDIRLKVENALLFRRSSAMAPPVIDKSQRQFLEGTSSTQPLVNTGSRPRVMSIRTMPDLQTKLKQSNNEDNFGDFLYRTAGQKQSDEKIKKELLTSVDRQINQDDSEDEDFIFADDNQGEQKVECDLVNSIQFGCEELRKSDNEQQWGSNSGQLKDEVMEIITLQSIEGSWKDSSILRKIYENDIEDEVAKDPKLLVALTFLVVKWLEKHCSSRQYGLIIKKGLNYLRRQAQNCEDLNKKYHKWIP